MIMRLWYLLTSLTLTFGLPQDFLRQSISKWDSHVQEAQKNNVQRGCKPQRRAQLPYNSTSKPKGVVLIFHGYTACPDAMENIADALLKAGYYSWIPLNPGHGRQLGSCATKASDCIEGVPAGFLPSNKKDYIQFSEWAVDMFKEEVEVTVPRKDRESDFVIATLGLSLGGPMTQSAAFYGNGLFTHAIAVNPFYSISFPDFDFKQADCRASLNPRACMQVLVDNFFAAKPEPLNPEDKDDDSFFMVDWVYGMVKIVKWLLKMATWPVIGLPRNIAKNGITGMVTDNYDDFWGFARRIVTKLSESSVLSFGLRSYMNQKFSWGANCLEMKTRPGYCTFRIKNLVAINNFGLYSMAKSVEVSNNTKVAYIIGQRDGSQRNGLTLNAALRRNSIAKGKTSLCIFQVERGTDLTKKEGNWHGMPHSCFSEIENKLTEPGVLYWKQDLFSNILSFLSQTNSSAPAVIGSHYEAKTHCTKVPLNTESRFFFVEHPQLFSFGAVQSLEFALSRYGSRKWRWNFFQ